MTSPTSVPAPSIDDSIPTHHPKAFYFFFWGEFAERASYYGMRAILPLYLSTILHFNESQSGSILYTFKMACYLLPLLGGYLADRFFGKYWTIVGFSIPYVLGHFVLGIENQTALLIALALLAGGSGVIKPNISSLMGQTYDQQRPGQEQLRSSAFLWYYFSINIGSFLSTTLLPSIRDHHGYAAAFQFPAWLMVISLAFFALGKKHYAVETIGKTELTPEQRHERNRILKELFGIFFLIVFFWIAYEHHDSLWVFFIRNHVDLSTGLTWNNQPLSFAPDQLQAINPWTVMIFAPLFSWLFQKIDPHSRVLTPGNKMFAGFLLQVVASGLMSIAGFLVAGSEVKVSLAWPVAAYFILTIAEILVYGTGLEFAYAAAPKNLKSFVTACFLMTSALANMVNIGFAHLYVDNLTPGGEQLPAGGSQFSLSPGPFFALSALIVLVASIGFFFVSRAMNRQLHGSAGKERV